jgi:hypothetical protein
MHIWRSLLLILIALALTVGSSGLQTSRVAMADLTGMAKTMADMGKAPSERSMAGPCAACGKPDVAKRQCLPICIAPAIAPEMQFLRIDVIGAALSPFGEGLMSGSIPAPDPYPPKTSILA